jgi:hypothetical protein
VAVKPQPELEPFFELNYEEFVNEKYQMRPRWGSNPHLQYLELGLFPVISQPPIIRRYKLDSSLWPEILEQQKTKSLRQLAKEQGVSYETVRRILKAER